MVRTTSVIMVAALLSACAQTSPAPADSAQLWVGNKGEDTVSVVDLATGEEIKRLRTTANAPTRSRRPRTEAKSRS